MKCPLQSSASPTEQTTGGTHVAHQSPYLTAPEAARYLRYASVRALYKAVVALGIPCCRRGGKTFLFDRRELDDWLRGSVTSA